MAKAYTSSAESATEWCSPPETAAGAAMVTLDSLPGAVMTTVEMPPGAAIAITIIRALFEPLMMVGAVLSNCSIEMMAKSELWSMETMTL